MNNRGIVYLVGAGPGDRELLTIKGEELLKAADVVVYDRLVSQSIMDLIPKTAKLINVGKNVGNHPVPQERINEILLEEAEKGLKVVRLKGGDPFVFGRGGEELELLAEKGIDFQVVPGITSSIAVPAYAGIPVTHRDYCSSLHIITGHAKKGAELKIDFDALVRLNGTLVFMMSVANTGAIAKGLMNAGMKSDMPCAVIENGTYSGQRKFISTLADIEKTLKENSVKSPAVIVVGKVCSLSENFDWFEKLPLRRKRIIVTQPKSKSSRLERKLRKAGAETRLYPCIVTEYIRPVNPPFEKYSALLFTSSEGVHSFFKWLREQGKDSRVLGGKKFAAIGSATADALLEYGIIADFVPSVYDGIHLAEELVSGGHIDKSNKVILLRAEKGTREITDVLRREGIEYLDYPVYRTTHVKHEAIENLKDWDYVTFTSRSCVEGFASTQKCRDFTGMKALCIGKQTGELAAEYGFDVIISKKATIDSMVQEVINEQR